MFDASTLRGQNLKGPIVGAVQVNEPFKYTDRSYECAAWWEEREAQKGVYAVHLYRNYLSPHHLYLSAEIAAKVTDDYFPGLWGGVPISREPYKPKHLGESRTIRQGIELEEALNATGASSGSKLDWFLHPSWWQVFTEEALHELREDFRRLPEYWKAWADMKPEDWKPNKHQEELRWTYSDEYRSKVGMIAHMGKGLEFWARRLEKITWSSQYHGGQRYDTPYHRENYAKNTEWAKAIPIQVNE